MERDTSITPWDLPALSDRLDSAAEYWARFLEEREMAKQAELTQDRPPGAKWLFIGVVFVTSALLLAWRAARR
jgi:hypothetical protein